MAKLVSQGQAGLTEPLELRLGRNRLGRGPHNDFSIDHATVSALHCEVELTGDGLTVRDLGSTNGTFVNGQAVRVAWLQSGQYLRLGSVEFRVEVSDARVVIPEGRPAAVPPVLKTPSGRRVCLHHEIQPAVWKCTRCQHLYCTSCIHLIRRRGGQILHLCPDCSGTCEVLPEFARQRRASWFGVLRGKLKLTRLIRRGRGKSTDALP